MIHELVFTSAPEGLRPGSQGFCTVAHSLGIPSNLALRLETFSAYRHLFQPPSPKAVRNPVMCMHLTLNLGGKRYHVLSRIADAGLDYTQRTNKIAHHFLFEDADCPEGGPATLFFVPNLFLDAWKRKPGLLPKRTTFPFVELPPLAGAWERLGFDRGWANAVAETVLTERPVSVLFEPGTDVLPLFAEAMARLPVDQRWRATFSSYYNKLPPGIGCQWKGIVRGSLEAAEAGTGDALVIDLSRPLGKPPARSFAPPPRKTITLPTPTETPPTEIFFEPEAEGIYGISELADLSSKTSLPTPMVERSLPTPLLGVTPRHAAVLLLVAFLLGCGVGALTTARWFRPKPEPPQSSFLLDCIDLLLPNR